MRSVLTRVCQRSYVDAYMRSRTSFYIDAELQQALKALKERDGVPEAESIRRALSRYLEAQGVLKGQRRAKTKTGRGK